MMIELYTKINEYFSAFLYNPITIGIMLGVVVPLVVVDIFKVKRFFIKYFFPFRFIDNELDRLGSNLMKEISSFYSGVYFDLDVMLPKLKERDLELLLIKLNSVANITDIYLKDYVDQIKEAIKYKRTVTKEKFEEEVDGN